MMNISRDIHSLTEFKKNTAAYQKLRRLAEESRVREGIRQGIDRMNAGRTISLDEFRDHARTKHGIKS